MNIQVFTFNPFSENTYVLYDETRECVIVDPGCYTPTEQIRLKSYIEQEKLKPVRLILTHCHIDHVLGNAFVYRTWGLKPEHHKTEIPMLARLPEQSKMFGIPAEASPEAEKYIEPGVDVTFGKTTLKVLFTPGHSPASVCFYHEPSKECISGDILF